MSSVPVLLIAMSCLSQDLQGADPVLPETPAATAVEGAPPGEPVGEEPQTVDSEIDKILRENADKIDQIPYVSAEIRQTIRLGNREIVSTGKYRRGPDLRMRFELDVDLGEATGKRIQVCNGTLGYRYEKMMEVESLQSFDVSVLVPLIERKEIPGPIKEQLLNMIPFLKPGDMLRGYLRTMTFTSQKEDVLGTEHPRDVTVMQGHWRPELLAAVSGNPNVPTLEELGESIPQYVRIFLDKETGWPIRVELFRQDKQAVYRPIFTLEFSELTFADELPADEFAFAIPQGVVPADVTATLVGQLQNLPDRAGVESADAPGTSVSPLIEPATKSETTPEE